MRCANAAPSVELEKSGQHGQGRFIRPPLPSLPLSSLCHASPTIRSFICTSITITALEFVISTGKLPIRPLWNVWPSCLIEARLRPPLPFACAVPTVPKLAGGSSRLRSGRRSRLTGINLSRVTGGAIPQRQQHDTPGLLLVTQHYRVDSSCGIYLAAVADSSSTATSSHSPHASVLGNALDHSPWPNQHRRQ